MADLLPSATPLMTIRTLVDIHIPKGHVMTADAEKEAAPTPVANAALAIVDNLYGDEDGQLGTQKIEKGVTVKVARRLGRAWVYHKLAVEVGK